MLHNDPYSEYNYYISQFYVPAAYPGPSTVQFVHTYVNREGRVVASWLVRSSPERAVRVRALAGATMLCSWAIHLTLTVSLSTQEYKCKPTISVHTSIHIRMQTTRVSRVYVQVTSRLVLIKLKAANLSRGFYCYVIDTCG